FTSLLHAQPTSSLFPYTTLFRSVGARTADVGDADVHGDRAGVARRGCRRAADAAGFGGSADPGLGIREDVREAGADRAQIDTLRDRKSTRLNSSHLGISYAVFCL